MTDTVPNPGSEAALERGCSCPVLDNNHGRSDQTRYWVIDGDCPLHAHGWQGEDP
jgi:hypothetical protein